MNGTRKGRRRPTRDSVRRELFVSGSEPDSQSNPDTATAVIVQQVHNGSDSGVDLTDVDDTVGIFGKKKHRKTILTKSKKGVVILQPYASNGNGHSHPFLSSRGRGPALDQEEAAVSWGTICVVIGALFCTFLTFVFPWLSTDTQTDLNKKSALLLHWHKYRNLNILGFVWGALVAACSGLACCWFSWTVTYFDSLQPGKVPPTPISPSKYKLQSGHTYHSGYIMSVVNGITMSGYALWWLFSNSWMT